MQYAGSITKVEGNLIFFIDNFMSGTKSVMISTPGTYRPGQAIRVEDNMRGRIKVWINGQKVR